MSFCSLQFCLFLPIVLLAYWAMPWHKVRVLVLLAASLYFYACWNHWLALVLAFSTLCDYLIARGMEATANQRLRKLLLGISLVGNVGLLCYFKYANFFLRSVEDAASACGLGLSLPVLRVILPVGISFYTFEAINYTVDVFRGKVRAEKNLAHFMLFVLFFPHLVAGPIVRARAFLPLVARRKHWSWLRAHAGAMLILLGVIKKLAIADRLALYVDPVFADPAIHDTFSLWLATVAYTIQMFCDFSGYSDMALGLAHLFGYHLATNFNMPFLSANITELWGRWHISLSTWIRDYIFQPLGGARGGRLKTYRNVLITFALCGLWHGASWNFILWGFLMGTMLVGHSVFKSWCSRHPKLRELLRTAPGTAFRVGLTFTCFCLTGVFFRCTHLASACTMYARMFTPSPGAGLSLQLHGLYLTFAVVALGHALGRGNLGWRLWERLPVPVRGFAFAASMSLAVVLTPPVVQPFLYFQF